VVAAGAASGALAESNHGHSFGAKLDGYQETPTLSSAGTGRLSLSLDAGGTQLSYELTFSGLSSPAMAAHIHLGRPAIAGGVAAFLCGGGGKPACPAAGGTVSGTIVAADVIGPVAQGLAAGDFASLLRAIRSTRPTSMSTPRISRLARSGVRSSRAEATRRATCTDRDRASR